MFTWDKYSISGGLVGYLGQYGEIYDCYTEGTVEARIGQGNGGIAGLLAAGNSSVIKNCFSTCEMKGTDATGGIAGLSIGVIEDCYFAGSISKGSYTIGGDTGEMGMLVGKYSGSGLKNCEYYGDTSPGIGAVGTDSTGTYTSVVDKGALPDTPITTLHKVDYSTGDDVKPIEPEKNLSIKLQVGINAQESSQIIIKKDFNLRDLQLDLSSTENAKNAITEIDKYLKQINEKQTEYGAAYNRLESALESIGVSIDNLTSTQSTIKDADITEESSEYIKMQILQQASATLLATANQTPSIALQLL